MYAKKTKQGSPLSMLPAEMSFPLANFAFTSRTSRLKSFLNSGNEFFP
jgi:hypothetical protein